MKFTEHPVFRKILKVLNVLMLICASIFLIGELSWGMFGLLGYLIFFFLASPPILTFKFLRSEKKNKPLFVAMFSLNALLMAVLGAPFLLVSLITFDWVFLVFYCMPLTAIPLANLLSGWWRWKSFEGAGNAI